MNMHEIIPGVTACEYANCESYQHELEYISGRWVCSDHLELERETTRKLAMSAMLDIGLPEDECERMLEDIAI